MLHSKKKKKQSNPKSNPKTRPKSYPKSPPKNHPQKKLNIFGCLQSSEFNFIRTTPINPSALRFDSLERVTLIPLTFTGPPVLSTVIDNPPVKMIGQLNQCPQNQPLKALHRISRCFPSRAHVAQTPFPCRRLAPTGGHGIRVAGGQSKGSRVRLHRARKAARPAAATPERLQLL